MIGKEFLKETPHDIRTNVAKEYIAILKATDTKTKNNKKI